MKLLLLCILVVAIIAQTDPRRPKPSKSQYITNMNFTIVENGGKKVDSNLANATMWWDQINQRIRWDMNLTVREESHYRLLMLDWGNNQAYMISQEGNSKVECELGVPDERENPFMYNHFRGAKYSGYNLVNERMSGKFENAEFVWPVIGKGEYNYDIFDGFPTRIFGRLDDLALRVDYNGQRAVSLNDEHFHLPQYIQCEDKKRKISSKINTLGRK